jgi:hypothetical protein
MNEQTDTASTPDTATAERARLQALIDGEELAGYHDARVESEWLEATVLEQTQLQERFQALDTEKQQRQQAYSQREMTRRATIDAWERQLKD